MGHKFLKIIDECFPLDHPLHKILNRNTLKLSYSCMPNFHNIISAHNKSLLTKVQQTTTTDDVENRECNCRQEDSCPLSGKCLAESIVYQATVTREDNNEIQTYVGLTAGRFKTRFNNHRSSFKDTNKKHATELSKYIWSLKESNVQYPIKWKILRKCKAYSNKTKRCNLCLHEKFLIIYHPELSSLNRRNELITTCRHRKIFLLSNSAVNTIVNLTPISL